MKVEQYAVNGYLSKFSGRPRVLIRKAEYLFVSDIETSSGPFIYITGTQPMGRHSRTKVATKHDWRIQDYAMEASFPKEFWRICNGRAGTVIVADTVGFHKGGFTTSGCRGVLVLTYTAIRPLFPSSKYLGEK